MFSSVATSERLREIVESMETLSELLETGPIVVELERPSLRELSRPLLRIGNRCEFKGRKLRFGVRRLDARFDDWCAGRISFAQFDASAQAWINHARYADTLGLQERILARYVWGPDGPRSCARGMASSNAWRSTQDTLDTHGVKC